MAVVVGGVDDGVDGGDGRWCRRSSGGRWCRRREEKNRDEREVMAGMRGRR